MKDIFKENIVRILFGIVAIFAAVMLFGNMYCGWSIRFLDGWWALFLIIPGVAGMVTKGFKLWYLFVTLLGVWLYANSQGWLIHFDSKIYFCIMLAVFGVWLIIDPYINKNNKQ